MKSWFLIPSYILSGIIFTGFLKISVVNFSLIYVISGLTVLFVLRDKKESKTYEN